MRIGTMKRGSRPEIEPPTRVSAAVIGFFVRRNILRHGAHAAQWSSLRVGNIHIEERTTRRMPADDLLDDCSRVGGSPGIVGGTGTLHFQRTGNARDSKEGTFNRSRDSSRI